jgi:hypothetical protein
LGSRLKDIPGREFPELPDPVAEALQGLWATALESAYAAIDGKAATRDAELNERESAIARREAQWVEQTHAAALRTAALKESVALAREQLAAANQRELPCNQVLSMLYIGVVDTNYQGLGGLRRLDSLSVRSVKSFGLEFPAYSQRVTANRHVACTHIAETADLKDPGCRPIRHPSAKFGEQIANFWRCPPRNDFTEREVLAVPIRNGAAAAGPIPATPKSKRAENRLNAFGTDVLNALGFPTIHALSSAESIGVRLAANEKGENIKVFASVFKGSSSLRHRLSRFVERMGISPAEPTTLMTDGAESLLRLKRFLPIPTRCVLDYFHVTMKVRHVDQCIGRIPPYRFSPDGSLFELYDRFNYLRGYL